MECVKEKLLRCTEEAVSGAFAIGCDIYDHPECGGEEYYASGLLTQYLEKQGFTVERGVGGMETAFRAVWERGSGGPSIGILMEYDALPNLGHACGHHLQSVVAIGAALALRKACSEDFRLVLYGTPDEEGNGGKITMMQSGCFTDVDVMFGYHTSKWTYASYGNKALAPFLVTFRGVPAHAAGAPWKGRSALDAMMLCFHGLEILREHVEDGCRIHYTVLDGTGPSNIVHESAGAHITLRSGDRRCLETMIPRMRDVIQGACLMTGTEAEIVPLPEYWNYVPVERLRSVVLDAAEEVGAPHITREKRISGGSSDVGNVSWVVPTVNVYTYYCDHDGHTLPHKEAGKSEIALASAVNGAKVIALSVCRILQDPALLRSIREEHASMIRPEI